MAIVSFTTQFDFTGATNLVKFTDTSDYAGQGINLADVNGSFRIVDPSGVTIYDNTDFTDSGCDIDVATSLSSQQVISFTPVQGTYTIIYTVDDINTVMQYTDTNTYNNQYTAPTLEISQTINCITPLWSQVDITDYVVAGLSPTTNTTVNRLFYPVGSEQQGFPVTTNTATLSTGVFFQGCQTSQIQATLQYDFSDGLQVIDVLQLDKEFVVDCTFYCSIACCVQAQEQLMISYRGNNQVLFLEEERKFLKIAAYITSIRTQIDCNAGNGSQVSFYMDEIRSLSNCTSDCDCSTDDFARVIGFGAILGIDGTDGTNGTDGTDGSDGASGTSVVSQNTTVDTPLTGSYASMKSFSIPAGTLPNNGDTLQILATCERGGSGSQAKARVLFGGNTLNPVLVAQNDFQLISGLMDSVYIKYNITRLSATTVMVTTDAQKSSLLYSNVQVTIAYVEPSITVLDLDASANLVDFQAETSGGYTMVAIQLQIIKLLTP